MIGQDVKFTLPIGSLLKFSGTEDRFMYLGPSEQYSYVLVLFNVDQGEYDSSTVWQMIDDLNTKTFEVIYDPEKD